MLLRHLPSLTRSCRLSQSIPRPFLRGAASSVPGDSVQDPSNPRPPESTVSDPTASPSLSIALARNVSDPYMNQDHFPPPGSSGGDPNANTSASSSLPSPPRVTPETAQQHQTYFNPPFHTHHFFAVLEKTFPTPTARSLMRATRALLVDRTGRVRREGLNTKDMENQAYLFKAAISELRSEVTMATRKETSELQTRMSSLRRDLDSLDHDMGEEISKLKHEIQMDLEDRKNEAKATVKQQTIVIEGVTNKAIVSIGDCRTEMEEVRWDNMRGAVVGLATFVLFVVIGMELSPRASPASKPPARTAAKPPEAEGLEKMDWVT